MKTPLLFIAAMYAFWVTPVTVVVRPSVTHEPGSFRVYAMIERHPDNRKLVLKAVLYDVFAVRSTDFVIEGRQRVFAPVNRCSCWFDLPAGEYDAVADLTRMEDGRERHYTTRQPFRVLGPGAPIEW